MSRDVWRRTDTAGGVSAGGGGGGGKARDGGRQDTESFPGHGRGERGKWDKREGCLLCNGESGGAAREGGVGEREAAARVLGVKRGTPGDPQTAHAAPGEGRTRAG
ncbi:hypothetical protein E2C01_087316 [Portunus trituberculatus]|uniref:Uncharacterized protein n=1 Tax=Portunus trituberculatus TaxID=210409 RepID=A0A5B7JFU8_PORTR|nr:hypothetical protein [Portunus trituberculatus]